MPILKISDEESVLDKSIRMQEDKLSRMRETQEYYPNPIKKDVHRSVLDRSLLPIDNPLIVRLNPKEF